VASGKELAYELSLADLAIESSLQLAPLQVLENYRMFSCSAAVSTPLARSASSNLAA
jgi:hypothetical protein